MAPKSKAVKKDKIPSKKKEVAEPEVVDDSGFRGNGVLTSTKTAYDLKIEGFTLHAYGGTLIHETSIELNRSQRYGLIGKNGSGKSTWLKSLAARDVPIPEFIDIFLLEREAPATDMTPLQYVVSEARKELEKLEDEICRITEEDPESELLPMLYSKVESMDPNTFEVDAAKILHGLGFDKKMSAKTTSDMSGGWRMRVALAKALFVKPDLMLLDEPTNHLDLEACVWLERYLAKWDRCLVVTSHSQEFLNNVCTSIIHLTPKKLFQYYSGNYDQFIQTKAELEVNQMKQFKKEQDDIKHLKKFISSCGTYANLVRQAKSKQKILDKMEEAGLTEEVKEEQGYSFEFLDCEKLPPPVLDVLDLTFSYSGHIKDALYKKVNLALHSDSRIALVGPNGAGKSTLLKLLVDNLVPLDGEIKRHSHLRFGYYNQHMEDVISLDDTPLSFMIKTFGEGKSDEQLWRSALGRFGVTGPLQKTVVKNMSDGQKRRLMFCYLAYTKPNFLLLDEPTNHLDMETIDALAGAIKKFPGGMVLVSHDFRLIEQVCDEVWLCDNLTVKPIKGGIHAYKKMLEAKFDRE